MSKIVVSVSGGETSAYLAKMMLDKYPREDLIFIYANTGEERIETLDFLDSIDKEFSLNLVWVEAVVSDTPKVGTSYNLVNRETASISGAPFIGMCESFGVPNQAYPHCTRELKDRPITAYLRDMGVLDDCVVALGIRADEPSRHPKKPQEKFIYPLIPANVDKTEVNIFWEGMPFRLELKDYQGNCKTCWKKTDTKLAAIYDENPEYFNQFAWLEKAYPFSARKNKGVDHGAVFWRKGRSTEQLIVEFKHMKRHVDLYRDRIERDPDNACGEACEPFQMGFNLETSDKGDST